MSKIGEPGRLAVTQKTLDKAIIRFIIEDIQPLSIVESTVFINLLRIGLPSQIHIMCRKTLRQKLCDTYFEMKATLDKKLTEIELVATTADLWSKAKRLVIFYIFIISLNCVCNYSFFIFYKIKFKFVEVT